MKDHNEQPLGKAIEDFLNVYNLQDKIDGMRLINSWEHVVGSMIANHTTDLFVSRKTLFVHLDSAAVRNELVYAKSLILKNLNKEVGKEVINDIVFK
ncbi:MAG: DUF721 domain-containing protein [Bacteroidetes bacterium HGW-Bacteroidetes-1]|jgi:predicted nucleic acid-binding Zn ribbon protein|nr:MAG: DUF721 domain-containing protein [Bacteroidetes bacterium HGW-Bacteroidetes-1]